MIGAVACFLLATGFTAALSGFAYGAEREDAAGADADNFGDDADDYGAFAPAPVPFTHPRLVFLLLWCCSCVPCCYAYAAQVLASTLCNFRLFPSLDKLRCDVDPALYPAVDDAVNTATDKIV